MLSWITSPPGSHVRRRTIRHLGLAVALSFATSACDREGKKECAWVLEPEPNLKGTTDSGFIPVCARNRTSMKEDCRLQTTIDYAQKVYGRKFRYVDLRTESPGLPRTIATIKFCDGRG